MWAWEVEKLPHSTFRAFPLVDEIWGLSHFIKNSLDRHSPVPVHVLPLPIVEPEVDPSITRATLGLPEGFVFLFIFDHLSVLARKNPLGVIEAFSRAFEPGEGPTLVIKSINGDRCRTDRERVRHAASGRDDIVLIEDYLSAAHTTALTALCDCYVSLHRSEGFGLTMAEAMALGKPVIATGYSGNLDFMDPDTALLVPYDEVAVGLGAAPYSATAVWAEPDQGAAAAYLRKVYDSPDFGADLGRAGQRRVIEQHSLAATAAFLSERVAAASLRLSEDKHLVGPADDAEPVVADQVPATTAAPTPHEQFRSAVDAAARQIATVPDPNAPTRLRPVVPAVRRLMNRVLTHHDLHQRLSLSRILDSVRALSDDDQMSALHLSRLIADQRVRAEQLQERVDDQLRLAYAEVEQVTLRHRAFNEQLRLQDRRSRELDLRIAELGADSSRLDARAAELDARTQHVAEVLGQLAEDTGGSLAATSQALTEGLADAGRQLSAEVAQLREAIDLLTSTTLLEPGRPASSMVRTDVGALLLPADDTVVAPWMRFYGSWEPAESALLRSALHDGDTLLDIGAHVGYHTLAGARSVGTNGKVIAVEPSPDVVALLRANVRLNLSPELAGVVEVLPLAAWDEDTTLSFAQSIDGNSGDSRAYAQTTAGSLSVDGRRLDGVDPRGPCDRHGGQDRSPGPRSSRTSGSRPDHRARPAAGRRGVLAGRHPGSRR